MKRRSTPLIVAAGLFLVLFTSASAAAARTAVPAGTWGKAEEIRGIAALNKGGSAEVVSLSCVSAGNCGAGGYYVASSGSLQPFVVSESEPASAPPARQVS